MESESEYNKMSKSHTPKPKSFLSTRRDFVFKKLFGGFFLFSIFPFIKIGSLFSEPLKLEKKKYAASWSSLKELYSIQDGVTHLNTASLGLSPKLVVENIYSTLKDLEKRGRNGDWLLKEIRASISNFLGANYECISFTRNATEGINIAANILPLKEGDEILLTEHEHIGGSAPWIKMAELKGATIKIIKLDLKGIQNLKIFEDNISEKTKIVAFSHITCTTGLILPAKEIAELCRRKGIYSCIDGAQSAGMIELNLEDINPDFYSFSGYKWLGGPKGTGILYTNKRILNSFKPAYVGANSDLNFNLRSMQIEYKKLAEREEYGNRNIPLLIGLKTAVEFLSELKMKEVHSRNLELSKRFKKGLSKLEGVQIISPDRADFYASIISFKIKNKDYEEIVEKLRVEKQIRVRKVYENDLKAIRASFSLANNEEDVDYLLQSLKELIE